MDDIYNILRPYQINIIKKDITRSLKQDEINKLIDLKKNDISSIEKTIKYNNDTISIMSKENETILKLNYDKELKYNKIYKDNLQKIPYLKIQTNKLEIKLKLKKIELDNIINDINSNIQILSNQYNEFIIPENNHRYDE